MKPLPSPDQPRFPLLDPETYHDARTVAPGYDVYYLEKNGRASGTRAASRSLRTRTPPFIGFCRSRHARKPNP